MTPGEAPHRGGGAHNGRQALTPPPNSLDVRPPGVRPYAPSVSRPPRPGGWQPSPLMNWLLLVAGSKWRVLHTSWEADPWSTGLVRPRHPCLCAWPRLGRRLYWRPHLLTPGLTTCRVGSVYTYESVREYIYYIKPWHMEAYVNSKWSRDIPLE